MTTKKRISTHRTHQSIYQTLIVSRNKRILQYDSPTKGIFRNARGNSNSSRARDNAIGIDSFTSIHTVGIVSLRTCCILVINPLGLVSVTKQISIRMRRMMSNFKPISMHSCNPSLHYMHGDRFVTHKIINGW